MELTLYVIAGANGIGKTTSTFDLVPDAIPVINSDEIVKQLKVSGISGNINTYEYANREFSRLIQENINRQISFGIETNLCDVETWKFLIGMQKIGYKVQLIFLSTDNIEILNNRIKERVLRGEHFVTPAIVEERYINGLKLLNHYFSIPDKIQLIDNSDNALLLLEKNANEIRILTPQMPTWVQNYLGNYLAANKVEPIKPENLSSVEDVRKLYKNLKR